MSTHALSPWLRGSAQSPRMNPCPSARPGEGEQEENRQGGPPGLAASTASEDRGMPILFLLGVPGQSPRTPDQQERSVARRHITIARGLEAGWPRPAIPLAGSRGSVHDSPVLPKEGRAHAIGSTDAAQADLLTGA